MPIARTLRDVLCAGALTAALGAAAASAQDYPTRPITLVGPFPPGGSTTIVRAVAKDKSERGARPVDRHRQSRRRRWHGRKPRGGEAAPDGYTLLAAIPARWRSGRTSTATPARSARRFCCRWASSPARQHPGGASVAAGAFGRRAHRLCQGQSRQAQLWPRPGSARSAICGEYFSHCRGGEKSPTFPTRGRTGDESTSSAGTFPWLFAPVPQRTRMPGPASCAC